VTAVKIESEENSLKRFREYCIEYYGRGEVTEAFERLARYVPDVAANWVEFRRATWKTPDEGGHLALKFKELLAIGIEAALGKAHVGHVEAAIKAGATVGEVADVLGIAIMLAGMQSYRIGGKGALERAEKEAQALAKGK